MSAFALSNIYSNYLTTYGSNHVRSGRFDSHKKTELKEIYNTIVKQSEDAPLYFLDTSGASQKYAVSLKEDARDLKKAISSLTPDYSSSILDQKIASSDNEDAVEARYVGNVSGQGENSLDTSFDISVTELASGQVNMGRYLPNSPTKLESGTYSFDMDVNGTDYEFQFAIGIGDTNSFIQNRIARLINRSNVGVRAEVVESEEGFTSLRLESTSTGSNSDARLNFAISDNNTSKKRGAVDYFGMDNLAHEPSNAHFTINGEEYEAYSNTFTLDDSFEMTLKTVTGEGQDVHIGLKPNLEALTYNINHLAGAYNDFIKRAAEYTENYGQSDKIMTEMNRLSRNFYRPLSEVGLDMMSDGTIQVNNEVLTESASEDDPENSLWAIKDFTSAIISKSDDISLNPMNYTKQKLVAYKKPGGNFPNPYMTSMYSGMLFTGFC
ncbi:hypothetical protein QYZ88_001425 [Lachnospiraceae bacterium C1.1]|nr:hypothetical protein [Lachnospiraceae bacterium C1.1]